MSKEQFDPGMFDEEDPFEIDTQAAHLFNHSYLGIDDIDDVWPVRARLRWLRCLAGCAATGDDVIMAEDLARFQDPRASRFFIRVAAAADRRGGLEHRRRLVAGLSGRVVEVGAGHGPNFALYPPEVTEVIAVEPDAAMRAAAASAAALARVPVTVVAGHSDSLPLGDGEADAVVFSLVLCMVPEQAWTLAEAARVLRRGGEVRFYEHVRSPSRIRGLLQDAVTPLVAWRVGCHPNRDTVAAVQAAGLGVDQLSVFGFGPPPVKLRHVIGTAAKALQAHSTFPRPSRGLRGTSPRVPAVPGGAVMASATASTSLVPVQPVFTGAERLALAGDRGLTREA